MSDIKGQKELHVIHEGEQNLYLRNIKLAAETLGITFGNRFLLAVVILAVFDFLGQVLG